MRLDFKRKYKNQTLGLVYDLPNKLKNSHFMLFPEDSNAEWESQKTIDTIASTWEQLGFSVILFPIDSTFFTKWDQWKSQCTLIHSLVEGWGSLARESWIPSLCELSGIPFIGSGPFTQSLCMSKSQTKLTCQLLKIPTAPFYVIKNFKCFSLIPNDFFKETHFIKPEGEGSGMGIDASFSISNSKSNSKKIIESLLEKYTDGVIVEKYLSGEEYTSAMIGTPLKMLPIAEIKVDDGVYGLANKSKEYMGEKVTFPKLSKERESIIINGTKKLFDFLNMKDFARLDWKCDNKGNIYFLEANTLAGLSYYYSVLPKMAKEFGLDYSEFLSNIADSALSRFQSKNLWYGKTRIQKRSSKTKNGESS